MKIYFNSLNFTTNIQKKNPKLNGKTACYEHCGRFVCGALLELSRWASVSLRVVFVIEAMSHQCKSPFVNCKQSRVFVYDQNI